MRNLLQIVLVILFVVFSLGLTSGLPNYPHWLEYILLAFLTVGIMRNLCLQIAQVKLRQGLQGIACSLFIFACLRFIKLLIPEENTTAIRYLWYGFYPCFIMLGYYTLKIVQALDYSIPQNFKQQWFKYVLCLDILVIALVLTNDYHQLVFTFPEGFAKSNSVYGHGFLELPVKAYLMLQFFAPIVFLLKDAWSFQYLQGQMLLPIGLAVYVLVYNICYSLAWLPFRHSETVLANCLAVLGFWYSAWETGLIAGNQQYAELFYTAGIQQKLAAVRLRQQLFLRLEELVAKVRPRLLQDIALLQKEHSQRELVLQDVRLAASFLKKQCLMFLQGERYGFVPRDDYQAALAEAVRYAHQGKAAVVVQLELQRSGYAPDVALITHNFVADALQVALQNAGVELLINVVDADTGLELHILTDVAQQQYLETLLRHWQDFGKEQSTFSLSANVTEDAYALQMQCALVDTSSDNSLKQQNVPAAVTEQTYKEAWDTLTIPVAIADEKQQLILVNQAMHAFLAEYLHRKVRTMQALWQNLQEPQQADFTAREEAGRLVLELPNHTVYWAELSNFVLQNKNYMQLTLTPLEKQDTGWSGAAPSQDLTRLLSSLEEFKRQEVTEELHGRVHDFMGQRMAVLERFLSQDVTDYEQLVPLLENVLQDMRQTEVQSCALQLQNILASCASMGLHVSIKGNLPARQDWAQCFVNILREGITNAVRHGNATEIQITIAQEEKSARIEITSNGQVPQELQKGKGLAGMEKALQALHGSLKIILTDKFILVGEVGERTI